MLMQAIASSSVMASVSAMITGLERPTTVSTNDWAATPDMSTFVPLAPGCSRGSKRIQPLRQCEQASPRRLQRHVRCEAGDDVDLQRRFGSWSHASVPVGYSNPGGATPTISAFPCVSGRASV